ncbi:MAG: efflux RND transporter periplasmic adaptor subunit [Desulfobacterales bacterium]
MRRPKTILFLFGLMAAVLLAFFLFGKNRQDGLRYRTATIERGPIVSTVSTTGTLSAVVSVQVGSQVSGQIKELLADFNSPVKSGQIIARIDPESFEAKVRQARAELEVARANVLIQEAGVERAAKELANAVAALKSAEARTEKTRVNLHNARRNLERRRALFERGAVSESQIDDAQNAHDQLLAQLRSDEAEQRAAESQVATREAALKSARAQVAYALEQVRQKEAVLQQAEVDLENTLIRSPVDGVVIERAVDIGQTVAASFQAPKLFVIAQDLRRMQVEADVDEADIGRVREGQEVIFTVDAYAGSEFHGRVQQIRKAPRIVQNVVTYTVLVSAENDDLRLLPGMTATIQIIVDERRDALKIPNAALRFKPEENEGAPSPPARPGGGGSASTSVEETLNRLSSLLRLSEAQKNQVSLILSEAEARKAAPRGPDSPPEDLRREVQAQREALRKAIASLLTPEQRARYLEFLAAQDSGHTQRGRVYVPDKAGKPKAVSVLLGISDGTFTELVGGELGEGSTVILGVDRAAPTGAARPPRRFAF